MVDKYFEKEKLNEQKKFYMLKIVEYICSWILAIGVSICVYILIMDEEHIKNIMYHTKLTMNVDISFIKKVIYVMFGGLVAIMYLRVYSAFTSKLPNLHKRLEYLMKTKVE